MKVFLDTNVLIDYVCKRENFYERACILFDLAHTKQIEMSISTLSFINAYYVGLRYKRAADELRAGLLQIQTFVTVSNLDNEMLKKSLLQGVKDVEDAAQYYSALSVSADGIVTRNKKDFAFSSIPVYTPEELLAKIL